MTIVRHVDGEIFDYTIDRGDAVTAALCGPGTSDDCTCGSGKKNYWYENPNNHAYRCDYFTWKTEQITFSTIVHSGYENEMDRIIRKRLPSKEALAYIKDHTGGYGDLTKMFNYLLAQAELAQDLYDDNLGSGRP